MSVQPKSARAALWFCCALLLPAAAQGDEVDEARQWLDRMATAAHTLDYEGTFVYQHSGQLQAVRLLHSAADGVERERMVTLSGPSREVVRDAGSVTCIIPDSNSMAVDHAGPERPLPLAIAPNVDRIAGNYSLSLGGIDRVADREAIELLVQPHDKLRYGLELWVDTQSGLMLKSRLIDPSSEVVEQVLFTELTVEDRLPPERLKPQTSGRGLTWQTASEDGQRPAYEAQWEATQLPQGFTLDVRRRHNMPGVGPAVEHMVFSDGLASVSAFIEPHRVGSNPFLGSTRMGAVNAYARIVGDHRVTVVGEVPVATVELIGRGIRPLLGNHAPAQGEGGEK